MIKKFLEKIKNKKLLKDFNKQKEKIKKQNYITAINNLVDVVIQLELKNSGLLLTEDEAIKRAHNIFCYAKRNGYLGELNEVTDVLWTK